MHTEKLLRNIADQVKEAQLKLGYVRDTTRLYYDAASLSRLLDVPCADAAALCALLAQALPHAPFWGPLHYETCDGRVAIVLAPQWAEYVHTHVAAPAFLSDLISLFARPVPCTLDDVRRVFASHSAAYADLPLPEGTEFDRVLYFEDSSIDPYRYCFRSEMGRLVYHRFTKEDYLALFT